MELEVTEKRENVLLQRTEVRFAATHTGEKSPSREALRAEIAKAMNEKKDVVILDWARAQFGRPVTYGYAKVYKNADAALRTERKHILKRNGLLVEEKKKEKPAEKEGG